MMEQNSYFQLKVIDEEKGIIAPSIYDCFFEKFPEFICQICLSFVIDPISCADCDALFCKKCIYDYTNYSRTCPNRCDINLKPINRILRNLINQVKVACPFFFKGCQVILNYSNYNKHLVECEYGPYICKHCNCVNVRPFIESHYKICNEKIKNYPNAKCPSCGIVILNEIALLTHIYLCPEQMLLCNNCEKKLTLRELKKHQNENSCLVTQLENKIGFLNMKVRFYESQISSTGGVKELCLLSMKDKEKDIRKSQSFNNVNFYKKNEVNVHNERENGFENIITCPKNINEKKNQKEDFNQKNIEVKNKSKERNHMINIEIVNRNLHSKSNKIKTLLPYQSNQILFALADNTLELNTIATDSSITISKSHLCSEITQKKEHISQMIIFNKQQSLIIQQEFQKDLFLGTTNGFYFLYSINQSSPTSYTLIKIGKAVNSSITAISALSNGILALGTLSSNLIIMNPYTNKTIDTLNHSRKEILSIAYIKDCLITSSTKENSFYIWKTNNDSSYELKATIKEHNGWIWTTIEMAIGNDSYIFTGSGDKRIILWKFYPNEETVKNCLAIKGNNDSITCLKLYKIGNSKILISGSYDGVVKINTIEYNDKVDDRDMILFTSRCLLSVFNKDDIISAIALLCYNNNDDGNDNKFFLITTAESYEGFMVNEINFTFD